MEATRYTPYVKQGHGFPARKKKKKKKPVLGCAWICIQTENESEANEQLIFPAEDPCL